MRIELEFSPPPPPEAPKSTVEFGISLFCPHHGSWGGGQSREARQEALDTVARLPEGVIEKCVGRQLSLNELRALLAWARTHRRERAPYWEARVYRRMLQKGP